MNTAELTVARIHAWSVQHDPTAVALLCRAMTHENPVIAQHAKRALQHHPSPQKVTVLATFLTDPNDALACFAILTVAQARMFAVIPTLLEHFHSGATPAVRHGILRALALLPDPRIAPFLLPLLRGDDEPTQYLALRVYIVLLQHRTIRALDPLFALLQSPSTRLRQTTVWTLQRYPSRRVRQCFRTIARDDADPLVRIAALHGLCRTWSVSELQFILARLVNEADHTVRLQIEGFLQQIPPPLLQRGMRRLLRNHHVPSLLKAHGLRLLLQQPEQPRWCGTVLLDLLTHSSDEHVRLLLLPILGQLRTPATWSYLHALVRGHTIESYSALRALLEHPATWQPATLTALLADIWHAPMLLQSVFKLAHQRASAVPWPAECVPQLLRALAYPNSNVRYLAAHLLARPRSAARFLDFCRIALAADETEYRLYREALILWLSAPAALAQIGHLLESATVTASIQPRLLDALRTAEIAPDHIPPLLPILCDPRHALLHHVPVPFLTLLHHWLTTDRLTFDTLLAHLSDNRQLLEYLNALITWWSAHPPSATPDSAPLRTRLATAPPALQSALLQLLSFIPDAPIVPAALDLLDTTMEVPLRQRICRSLMQWCRGSEANDA